MKNAITHLAKYPDIDIEYINPGNSRVIMGCTLSSPQKPFSIGPSAKMDKSVLAEAKKRLATYLNTDTGKMVYVKQTHSDKILSLDETAILDNNMNWLGEYDGVISNIKGSQLNISIADCSGVLMYLPDSENYPDTIAAVHSGWKGTHQGITEKTIRQIAENYNIDSSIVASNIKVWLAPSASIEKYEVGEEFKEFFPNSISEKNGKLYFDNKHEIYNRLLNLGVPSENIQVCQGCTITNNQYHSYRRDGQDSGRMNAFIRLDN